MIPGPELSDEAVTVGFTVDGTTDETPVVVGVTVEPELAGVVATPEVVGDTLPGTPAVAGVEARPWLVGVVLTPVVAGEALAELVALLLGEDPEEIVGLDEVPAAATEPPVVPAVVAAAKPIAPPLPLAPLVTTGVGAELIDEFTVACGLAVSDGGMYCPVGWEGIFFP